LGPVGPQGPSGVSKAYTLDEMFPQVIAVPDSGGPIARIILPAGNFIVFASASFRNHGSAEADVECKIAGPGGRGAGADFVPRYVTLGGTADGAYFDAGTIAVQGTVMPITQTTYELYCSDDGGQVQVASLPEPNLTAVEVDSIYQIRG
jgi:hypothetical protein